MKKKKKIMMRNRKIVDTSSCMRRYAEVVYEKMVAVLY